MPGDLNLKKSWHPSLAKNKHKVELAEKSAVEDLRAKEARAAEIQKIRELEELKALQSGTPSKVRWIYEESKEPAGKSMEQEFRKLLKKKSFKKPKSKLDNEGSSGPVKASSVKSKADPMSKFLNR